MNARDNERAPGIGWEKLSNDSATRDPPVTKSTPGARGNRANATLGRGTRVDDCLAVSRVAL